MANLIGNEDDNKEKNTDHPGKLATIQSIPNENGTSVLNSLENGTKHHHGSTLGGNLSSKQLEEQRDIAKNMEAQLTNLNQAINQLRDDHAGQIEQMKSFYNDQIDQIRKEYGAQKQQNPMELSQFS